MSILVIIIHTKIVNIINHITNALFTLIFGTIQDNAQDLSAKIKRLKKYLAFNLTNLLDIC